MPVARAADRILQRPIPKTGETIPAVGLGTWQGFDVAGDSAATGQAREALKTLVELGGRVIDSSPMYGSAESVSGQLADELGVKSRLFVATKVWTRGKQATPWGFSFGDICSCKCLLGTWRNTGVPNEWSQFSWSRGVYVRLRPGSCDRQGNSG